MRRAKRYIDRHPNAFSIVDATNHFIFRNLSKEDLQSVKDYASSKIPSIDSIVQYKGKLKANSGKRGKVFSPLMKKRLFNRLNTYLSNRLPAHINNELFSNKNNDFGFGELLEKAYAIDNPTVVLEKLNHNERHFDFNTTEGVIDLKFDAKSIETGHSLIELARDEDLGTLSGAGLLMDNESVLTLCFEPPDWGLNTIACLLKISKTTIKQMNSMEPEIKKTIGQTEIQNAISLKVTNPTLNKNSKCIKIPIQNVDTYFLVEKIPVKLGSAIDLLVDEFLDIYENMV